MHTITCGNRYLKSEIFVLNYSCISLLFSIMGEVETLSLPMLYVKVTYLIEDLDEMRTTSKYICEIYNREHSMRKKVDIF